MGHASEISQQDLLLSLDFSVALFQSLVGSFQLRCLGRDLRHFILKFLDLRPQAADFRFHLQLLDLSTEAIVLLFQGRRRWVGHWIFAYYHHYWLISFFCQEVEAVVAVGSGEKKCP